MTVEALLADEVATEEFDREQFVELLEEMLTTKHCTLWGAQFSIWEPRGRRAAAEWIMKLLDDIADWEPAA